MVSILFYMEVDSSDILRYSTNESEISSMFLTEVITFVKLILS